MLASVTTATRPTPGTIPGQFTMSELVERTGVAPATVRYYLASGLLPPPVKVAPNRFLYDERHVELIRLIRILRERKHLALDAIAAVLPGLLPDLHGRPDVGGVFRPDVWRRLLSDPEDPTSGAVVAARILQAAAAAFAQQGYYEVTLDDVCRTAGIAKGSLYRHFASKEELFFAAARSAGAAAAARLSSVAASGSGLASLDEVLLADALMPELGILLDLAALAARRRRGAGEVFAQVITQLQEALRAASDNGSSEQSATRVLELVLGSALGSLALLET